MFHRKLIVLLLCLCFFAYGEYFSLNLGAGLSDIPNRLRRVGSGEDKELNLLALNFGGSFGYYNHDVFNANMSIQISPPTDEGAFGISSHYFDDGTQATYTSLMFIQFNLDLELFVFRKNNFGISVTGSYQFDSCDYFAYIWFEDDESTIDVTYLEKRSWWGGGIKVYPLIRNTGERDGGLFVSASYFYDSIEDTGSLPISIGMNHSQASIAIYFDVIDGWSKWGVFFSVNTLGNFYKSPN